MKELMDYLYTKLTEFALVHFDNIARDESGNISIDETNIVYKFGSMQTSSSSFRYDLTLDVDIWYLKSDIYIVEDMILDINDALCLDIVITDKGTFKIEKSNVFVLNIPDEDNNLRRKRLSYIVKFYGLRK